jgi:hypothetical protein
MPAKPKATAEQLKAQAARVRARIKKAAAIANEASQKTAKALAVIEEARIEQQRADEEAEEFERIADALVLANERASAEGAVIPDVLAAHPADIPAWPTRSILPAPAPQQAQSNAWIWFIVGAVILLLLAFWWLGVFTTPDAVK